eukprot:scaffold420571_cov46-Prasinocladus_malaysianus.AAC.1
MFGLPNAGQLALRLRALASPPTHTICRKAHSAAPVTCNSAPHGRPGLVLIGILTILRGGTQLLFNGTQRDRLKD